MGLSVNGSAALPYLHRPIPNPATLPTPPADWDASAEDPQDAALWEQDWDDDNIQDDFSQRLKAELQRMMQQQQQQGTGK